LHTMPIPLTDIIEAPAVEEKPTVVLTKTKSGRASKGPKQEEKAKVTKRKAPAKKATPKKTATPKKA
jgi:histone H1/5